VLAVEIGHVYVRQAAFALERLGLTDRVTIMRGDVYGIAQLRRTFDIVCYVGLSYHLRHPQLALDMLTRFCGQYLVASSQTIPGDSLMMVNRARHIKERAQGVLHGWEPTETLFVDMLAHAGFRNPRLVSTAPHPGETKNNICGNRSYFFAEAAEHPHDLPFVDESFVGKPELRR
jgi:hypothetical protein